VPDILAIVSKAIFERDARVAGKPAKPGEVWPIDRYNTTTKPFQALKSGGRIFLVTVRPPDERLWFVGLVDSPAFDGSAWIAPSRNALPVTDITPLRKTLRFESGKGISQEKGTLGMSLQTPRLLTPDDVKQILAVVGGESAPAPAPTAFVKTEVSHVDPPRRVIGERYEIMRTLAEGGMGVVHEARQKTTGRRVALKEILAEELEKDSDLLARFEREALVMRAVQSEHIASILDAGMDFATGHPFLVMELLHGEDLEQLLRRTGPLPEEIALRICAQACRGLACAHAANVIHRDIKPANLFLARCEGSSDVVVKVVDFGIARARDELSGGLYRRTLTSSGLMLGTPLYMSPEQVKGPKNVDARADVWSLGIVLYEMLTGRTPHAEEETLGGLLVAICATPAPLLTDTMPDIRGPIAALAKKALEIDPKRRYASIAELLVDLEQELPSGEALDDAMLAIHPASLRASTSEGGPDPALAATVAVSAGTLQSKDVS
jgi:hypothetical protein